MIKIKDSKRGLSYLKIVSYMMYLVFVLVIVVFYIMVVNLGSAQEKAITSISENIDAQTLMLNIMKIEVDYNGAHTTISHLLIDGKNNAQAASFAEKKIRLYFKKYLSSRKNGCVIMALPNYAGGKRYQIKEASGHCRGSYRSILIPINESAYQEVELSLT